MTSNVVQKSPVVLLTHAPCIMCETAVKSGALTLQNDTQSFPTGSAADVCDVKAIALSTE